MGYIKYSRNQHSKTDGLIPIPKLNPNEKHNIKIYDMYEENFDVFVKQIILSNDDSHIAVCLTTVNLEVVCYKKSENNISLDQIQRITLKTRENGIPYGFVMPGVSAFFDYSYDNENTPPSKFTPHRNSFSYDYGDGPHSRNLPPQPNPEKKPQVPNDDKSKDFTGSWINLWALVFFALIIIIVYMTFKTEKKTIQPSIYNNNTL